MTDSIILPITLIIVSDFDSDLKTWEDEDECLRSSLADPSGIPTEVIIAASSAYKNIPLPDWSDIQIPVKTIFVDSEYSGTIKNGATVHASQYLLAVVEADCIPKTGWLKGLFEKYQGDESYQVVSGLTMYEETSTFRRVSSLYDRSYMEETFENGDAIHASNNGALYEIDLLLKFPYPEETSPFISAHKRHITMKEAGIRFGLAKNSIQYHAFGGWSFILDLRKNKGFQYQSMKCHMLDTTPNIFQKFWWTLLMALHGTRDDYCALKRSYRTFCKPSDLPLAIIYPLIMRPFELSGAVLFHLGHRAVPDSSYR